MTMRIRRPRRAPRRWLGFAQLTGIVFVAGAVLWWLAGCSEPPESGYVLRKQHSSAYSYITMHCIANNPKTGTCTVWMPVQNYVPARWELCLQDDKDANETGCREVGEIAWNRYQIGEHYPDPR